jgi:hypothetical protein
MDIDGRLQRRSDREVEVGMVRVAIADQHSDDGSVKVCLCCRDRVAT